MPQLQSLRDECLTAFGKYAQEVQKTCGLLSNLQAGPARLDRLLAILEQTRLEDQAQEAYVLLRQQLFNVLGEIEGR